MLLIGRSREALWEQIPLIVDLTPDDVLRATIHVGSDAEDLARHLDGKIPGLLDGLCRRYLAEVANRILGPVLGCEPLANEALRDPRAYFSGEADDNAVRRRAVAHFLDRVDGSSPDPVKRLMVACIEYGLGDKTKGSVEAAFAVCEEAVEGFDLKFPRRDPEADRAVIATERRKAEILCELILASRRPGPTS